MLTTVTVHVVVTERHALFARGMPPVEKIASKTFGIRRDGDWYGNHDCWCFARFSGEREAAIEFAAAVARAGYKVEIWPRLTKQVEPPRQAHIGNGGATK
jgi:hypothetical protein